MPERRIVLASASRLLRDMLKRILDRSDKLTIVQEVTDQKELPSVLEHTHPEWVILSLSYDDRVPAWVDAFMALHPSIRFMGMAMDGSKIKVKWLEVHEQELDSLSLNELMQILENNTISP
jgi:DNA-binding NarL/FixJ family response regulator